MEMMDFYAMKRKKLQSLCKKHGIPANLKNVVMAEKLSLIFKGKENFGLGSDNAGTPKGGTFGGVSGKDIQNVIILDSGSSIDTSNIKMVASDIVAAGDVVDSGEEMFVSSGTISPGPDLGQKSLEEIGRFETILFQERVIENGLSKEDQVVDSTTQEYLHSEPDVVVMDDAEKQADAAYSPQGLNLLQVSPKEFDLSLIEQVFNTDDSACVDGALNSGRNERSESDATCFDNSVGAEDTGGFFYVEENMQTCANKEQGDDIMELQPAAPSVALEEFGDCLMEEIVEKLDEKTDVNEDVNGTREVAAEAENQDFDTSNIQMVASDIVAAGDVVHSGEEMFVSSGTTNPGPDLGQKNLEIGSLEESDDIMKLHPAASSVALEEYGDCLMEEIVEKLDEKTDVNEDVNGTRKVAAEAEKQDLTNNSQESNNICESVIGTAVRTEDTCEAKFVSSQKLIISPAEVKMIEFSPKQMHDLEPPIEDDIAMFDVEESMPVGVNTELVDNSQEVLHAEPCAVVMNEKDLIQVTPEEFGKHLEEGEVEKLGDKFDLLDDVCGTGEGGDEAVEQGRINSPQGSNINDMNLFHVSPEESEQVHKSDDNTRIIGAKNTDGKTNVTADKFLDEVHSFSLKYSDGTPNQFLLTSPSSEVKYCDLNVHKIVASGTAAGNADVCEAKFVSSQKISSIQEERIDSSPIMLDNLQIKRLDSKETLSPENRNELGLFHVEEHMQTNVNKEQGGDIKKFHPAAPSVTSEEFGDCLVAEKVEKLDNKTDVHGDVCGPRMVAAETENQDLPYNPQGSKINHENLLHVSPEKFSGSLVEEGEVHKIVASGTAAGNADACEAKFVSSPKISSSPEERIDSSPILLENSQISRLGSKANLSPGNRNDLGLFYVEEDMQTNANKEQGGDITELHPASPSVTSEEFGDCLGEEKVEKLDNKTDVHGDVCGTGMGAAEAEKQDLAYNPQGSNLNHGNLLHFTPEKSSGSLVEEELHKLEDNICVHVAVSNDKNNISEAVTMCLDAFIGAKDNVSVEQILEEAHSSSLQDSEGTPVQFPPTYPGTAIRTEDTCESKLVSSQKMIKSPASGKMIGICPKQIHNLETPMEDDIAMFDLEENMAVGVNKELGDNCQEVLHAEPIVVVMNEKDLVQVTPEEFGKHLEEGEIEELNDNIDLLDAVCGTGQGGDEAVEQGCVNCPQGSNINHMNLFHVSPEESGHPLVEQVQKSDDVHGGFYNLGKTQSEVDILRLLDATFATIDTDGKTNVTAECFPDEVHSDDTTDQFLKTHPQGEVMSNDLNIHQMVTSDTCEEMMKSSQMKAIIADLEECVWFSPNNVEASATKGFEAETHFEPSTLGGVVGACNMEESMQSDNMEKESGQKECSLVQGEFTRMFDNSDVHDDNGGTGKEECQPYTLSQKRKRSDMNSNESQPVDNASGQNSNEKPDEFVPTKSQPGEMKLHTSNTHQSFASDTASGDEVTYQEKMESPPKVTPIAGSAERTFFSPKLLESSMMNKENINIDKKEQDGTITSKNKFLKRQPLQDLQQN